MSTAARMVADVVRRARVEDIGHDPGRGVLIAEGLIRELATEDTLRLARLVEGERGPTR